MAMATTRPGPTDPARWAETEEQKAERDALISRATVCKTVSQRVAFIRGLMIRGEWESKLLKHLAAEWGCSNSNAHHYSAEASRNVRDALNPALIRSKVMKRLDAAYHRATQEEFSPAKGSEAMTKAALAMAQVAGIDGKAAQQKVTINIGAPAQSAVLDAVWGPLPELATGAVTVETTSEPADAVPAPEAAAVGIVDAVIDVNDWR